MGSLYEVSGAGSTAHLYAGSLRVASVVGGSLQYYHGDHLGSTHLVTNIAGQRVSITEYTPFGAFVDGTTPPPSDFAFTGQRYDDTSALYFYHARYYDPSLGRFLSPDPFVQDPADPQTLNRYTYVRNNPVKYVDPSGHLFGFIIGLIVAALVTVAVELTIRFLEIDGTGAKLLRIAGAAASAGIGGAVGGLTGNALINAMIAAASTTAILDTGEGRQAVRGFSRVLQNLGVGRKASMIIASTLTSTTLSSLIFVGLTTVNPNPRPGKNPKLSQRNPETKGPGGRPAAYMEDQTAAGTLNTKIGGGKLFSAPAFGDVKNPNKFTQAFERFAHKTGIYHTAFEGPSGADSADTAFPFLLPGGCTCQQRTFDHLINEGVRGIDAFTAMANHGGWTFYLTSGLYGVSGGLGLQSLSSSGSRTFLEDRD